jgi:hypothetical protein
MTWAGITLMIAALEGLAASRERTPSTRYVAFGADRSRSFLPKSRVKSVLV